MNFNISDRTLEIRSETKSKIEFLKQSPSYLRRDRDISELKCRLQASHFFDLTYHNFYDEPSEQFNHYDSLEFKGATVNVYEYKNRTSPFLILEETKCQELLRISNQTAASHCYFVNFVPDQSSETGTGMVVFDLLSPTFQTYLENSTPSQISGLPNATTSVTSLHGHCTKKFYRLTKSLGTEYIISEGATYKISL